MTKEQLFERIDFKEGDRVHVIICRDAIENEIERTFEKRINYGFSLYNLIGIARRLERDMYKILDGELYANVETVERTALVDDKKIKLGDTIQVLIDEKWVDMNFICNGKESGSIYYSEELFLNSNEDYARAHEWRRKND